MGADEFTASGPLTLDEMIKIFSLLENPPEAATIRKALRFYTAPDIKEYKWGNNSDIARTLHHFACQQDQWEMDEVLKVIDGSGSMLEIGSCFGGSLKQWASVMNRGATIVSVDLPYASTPAFMNSKDSLKDVCHKISLLGANVELIFGDSHSEAIVEAVNNFAPYDFVFIDGDHSYDGMKRDWESYGPMGRIVGFHDIGGPLEDCVRCWKDIQASCGYKTREIVNGDRKYGIGLVFREEPI